MGSKLFCEVIERVKAVAGVEAFLVLPVAAFYLAVVAGRIGADKLVPYAKLGGSSLKQGGQASPAVGKAVGKLKAVIGLDALHPDAPAGVPLEQPFQEISGGVGALFRIGSQEAKPGELINGGVLEQAKSRVCDTPAGHDLHIHLYPLAWMGHLLIRLGLVCFLLLGSRKHPQFTHDPEQAFRAAGVATFPQTVP